MNTICKGFLFLVLISMVYSCKKSFLEIKPRGQIGKEELFEDVDGLLTALNGNYQMVASYYLSAMGMFGDVRGDDIRIIPSSTFELSNEYNYQSDPENGVLAVTKIWQSGYEAISNINNVLSSTDELKLKFPKQTAKIDSIEGQALVLRALCHFSLAQVYSQHYTYTADASHLGIPVLSETPYPGTLVSRPTMKDTYQHILDDLDKAILLMNDHNNMNKVTASVEGAKAMRARLFLYMGKWQAVIDNVNEVLTSERFSLTPSSQYEQMYISQFQLSGVAGRASEVIWQFNTGTIFPNLIHKFYSDPVEFIVSPSEKLMALYEDGDVRKELFYTRGSRIYNNKYGKEEEVAVSNWPVNYKLFRLSELYLNRAEAYWHLNDFVNAAKDIKKIKARAMNVSENDIILSYSNNDELLELIKVERRKELAFEGHRIFDILRYKEDLKRGEDCNAAVCTLTYPNNQFVLPIPRLELDANKAMQPNPGVNN